MKSVTIVGSIGESQNKDVVRNQLVSRDLKKSATNWIRTFGKVLSQNHIRSSAIIYSAEPTIIREKYAEHAAIDLSVHFLESFQPDTAEHLCTLLAEERVNIALALSYNPINIEADWLQNIDAYPISTKQKPEGRFVMPDQTIARGTLQVRELDYYREYDMRVLLRQILETRDQQP